MIIYKQYNQQQLNNQYNNRLHVPDFATYLECWDKRSAATREKHAFIKDLQYGDHPRERLDIFSSGKPNAKVLVFIHGGYWQLFDKTKFHFVAEAFLPHNVTTVVINYPLAPSATIDEMVNSCCNAMQWLQQNLSALNANANEIYIAGHSAGAHLAAMIMCSQRSNEFQKFIKGICLISGLFNLIPIQLSYVNEVLHMDKEMAIRNSPIDLVPAQSCTLLVAAGTAETEEFKDQSRQLYSNWKNKTPVELIELPGMNHYSVLDALVNENALLYKAMLTLMLK